MSAIPANFTDGVFTVTDDNGNSATLQLSRGDQSLTGLLPNGRALVTSESRGALVGARKGARAFPTMTVSGILAGPSHAFHQMLLGTTAGFTSVTADIGDYIAVDFDWSFDYGAESRDVTGEDMVCTGIEFSEGEDSTVSLSFQILGPLNIDGIAVIGSR